MRCAKEHTLSLSVLALFLMASCTVETLPSAVESNILFDTETQTKGSLTTTAGLASNGNTFAMDALLEASNRPSSFDSNPHYISGKSFTFNASLGKWTSTCQWIDRVYTNFWARYPVSAPAPEFRGGGVSDIRQHSCSFSYSMPSSTGVTQYARDCCPDLVYAYARKRTNLSAATPDVTVRATFRHVLSAICFQAGEFSEGLSISKITIKGIYTSGTCSLSGSPSEDDDNVGDSFSTSWSALSAKETIGMAQEISQQDFVDGAMDSGGSKVFFLIPQTLSDDAKVTVTLVHGGSTQDATLSLGGESVAWEPGVRYIYKISFTCDYPTMELVGIGVNDWTIESSGLELKKN